MDFLKNYFYLNVYFVRIERTLRFLLLLLFSCQAMSYSSQPHRMQHTRLPCPSLSPRVCANSCPLSQWCHPIVSSFAAFSFCLHSFSASGSFPMSWLFTSGGHTIGISVSASVLPMNLQDWAPLSGIIQAKILEWVAIPSSMGSSQPRYWTWISYIERDSLPPEPPGN